MSNQRLNILMKKLEIQYASESPLILEASALYLDKDTNNCIAQLKWKNIDSRSVKAIKIELNTFDVFDQKLEPVPFQYTNLSVSQGAEFGTKTPILIKNNKVAKYEVELIAVSFWDDTVWRSDIKKTFTALPDVKNQVLSGDLLDQLTRDLSSHGNKEASKYTLQYAMGLWQCGCGSWQYVGTPCISCKMTEKLLSELSDVSSLNDHLSIYWEEQRRKKIEEERNLAEARIAREKAEQERKKREEEERIRRAEQAKQAAIEEAKQKAKKRRHTILGFILSAILLVGGYFIVKYSLKMLKYNEAKALLSSDSFDKARDLFSELGEFRDSAILLQELEADLLYSNGDYAAAYEMYSKLPIEYQIHENDYSAKYSSALEAYNAKNYLASANQFLELGNYKDSSSKYASSVILQKENLAESYKSSGDFSRAREIYNNLGYEDQATECLYLLADSQSVSQPWLAYDNFILLGEYKDSAERARKLYSKRYEMISDLDTNGYRMFYDPKTHGYGLLDKNYDVFIEPVFDIIILNEDTLYTVKSNGHYGVINSVGDTVIPVSYDNLIATEKGYKVELYGKQGILKQDGTAFISLLYDQIDMLDDGRFQVLSGNKKGIIDSNGNIIIEPLYQKITLENAETYTVVKDGKYGIILYDGTVVHEACLELIKTGSNDGKYLIFKKDDLYGFMDASSFNIIIDAEWKDVTYMTDGYAYIKNNLDNWGVIDDKGRIIVSPKWKYITFFQENGYASRSEDGSTTNNQDFLMDNRGTLVCDMNGTVEYLGNGSFRNWDGSILYDSNTKKKYSFTSGVLSLRVQDLRIVGKDLLSGKIPGDLSRSSCYGIIDAVNTTVISNYRWEKSILSLPCRNQLEGKYGWIGVNGKDLLAPEYDYMMSRTINGYIVAGKYNDRGYLVYSLIDPSNGKIVVSNLSTEEEAFNYFGIPKEDVSIHGQIMWILKNAGFEDESAKKFIENCISGAYKSAESIYEETKTSEEFKGSWSKLERDIRNKEIENEEKLLAQLIKYGLN